MSIINKQTCCFSTTTIVVTTHIHCVTSAINNHHLHSTTPSHHCACQQQRQCGNATSPPNAHSFGWRRPGMSTDMPCHPDGDDSCHHHWPFRWANPLPLTFFHTGGRAYVVTSQPTTAEQQPHMMMDNVQVSNVWPLPSPFYTRSRGHVAIWDMANDNGWTMDKDDGQQPGEWCKSPLPPFFTQAAGAMSLAVTWQMTTDEGQWYTTTTNDGLEVSTLPPSPFFQTRNRGHIAAGNVATNGCMTRWMTFDCPQQPLHTPTMTTWQCHITSPMDEQWWTSSRGHITISDMATNNWWRMTTTNEQPSMDGLLPLNSPSTCLSLPSLSQQPPLSTNGLLPQQMASPLDKCLPPVNKWQTASPLDEQPPPSLDKSANDIPFQQTASPFNKRPPPSLNKWQTAPSLPQQMANSPLPPSTKGQWPPLSMNILLPHWPNGNNTMNKQQQQWMKDDYLACQWTVQMVMMCVVVTVHNNSGEQLQSPPSPKKQGPPWQPEMGEWWWGPGMWVGVPCCPDGVCHNTPLLPLSWEIGAT